MNSNCGTTVRDQIWHVRGVSVYTPPSIARELKVSGKRKTTSRTKKMTESRINLGNRFPCEETNLSTCVR